MIFYVGCRSKAPVLDHRQSAERAWERLKSAFQFGDCLTTIATSAIEEAQSEALGLVPSHAYAVLNVKECLGKRFLLVKLLSYVSLYLSWWSRSSGNQNIGITGEKPLESKGLEGAVLRI